ncbi:hypothetical protein [Acinetobacter sp.]|uniref:hypothetical protein n=1 Tax=Acinetobacter sp. TaxID=472 RepID=UPI00388D7C23
MSEQNKAGCEREDGLLNIHSEDTTCEVCHFLAPIPEQASGVEGLAEELERIAQSWDGCEYDAPGEILDIGASLRREFSSLTTQSAKQGAQVPKVIREAIEAAFEEHGDWRYKIAAAVRAIGEVVPAQASVEQATGAKQGAQPDLHDGYLSSIMTHGPDGSRVVLHYDRSSQAEAAHAALCSFIDAALSPDK